MAQGHPRSSCQAQSQLLENPAGSPRPSLWGQVWAGGEGLSVWAILGGLSRPCRMSSSGSPFKCQQEASPGAGRAGAAPTPVVPPQALDGWLPHREEGLSCVWFSQKKGQKEHVVTGGVRKWRVIPVQLFVKDWPPGGLCTATSVAWVAASAGMGQAGGVGGGGRASWPACPPAGPGPPLGRAMSPTPSPMSFSHYTLWVGGPLHAGPGALDGQRCLMMGPSPASVLHRVAGYGRRWVQAGQMPIWF